MLLRTVAVVFMCCVARSVGKKMRSAQMFIAGGKLLDDNDPHPASVVLYAVSKDSKMGTL